MGDERMYLRVGLSIGGLGRLDLGRIGRLALGAILARQQNILSVPFPGSPSRGGRGGYGAQALSCKPCCDVPCTS